MTAIADVCPNCGSPLKLEPDGTCHFCHSPVHVAGAAPGFPQVRPTAGPDLHDSNTRGMLMPMDACITVLGSLSREPGMVAFCSQPGVLVGMQQMVDGLFAAAARIAQLPDRKDRNGDLNPKVVTEEELWLISLCLDTGKQIAAEPGTEEFIPNFASDTDRYFRDRFGEHRIRKAHKQVTPPTPELEQLRALVPTT
jgi:hypothetical protein